MRVIDRDSRIEFDKNDVGKLLASSEITLAISNLQNPQRNAEVDLSQTILLAKDLQKPKQNQQRK